MLKRIIISVAIIIAAFFISYGLNKSLVDIQLQYSLFSVYLFHALSAIIVYLIIEFLFTKLPNQVGYAYLMLMCFKIGAFVLIFQKSVFAVELEALQERISLVVPLFIFLIIEALLVGKLLTNK
ncbi:hypothetical protein FHS04_000706 [Mesoflavibacter sabulilitoris]|uniref:Uncharacterized protein n=1 Tax=Mesoflavibacter zeaxanthinifaciens subsp. sabulilitoris TaxID=1520893 RepID=A0A2T1N6I5_9FLAO|nr:DUF6168 family protein [Mesoflavibacter zeaxanthinifaciens]MBB3123209.1 hypothetical protein [Mesoflavibacter zeaxanthinifaciens subsp. sabulilitoris]PSG87154.1 hypothetical protein C7H61_13680 [Mesoflavibacter zeaxanthinifaciens subsp. sabulilitoris]